MKPDILCLVTSLYFSRFIRRVNLLDPPPKTCLLTHWGRNKMDVISQTTFSNAFSWMKTNEFRFRFHWSLFLRVQLTIFQHWFRQWLGADQATSHCLNQLWLDYRLVYVSLVLNELIILGKLGQYQSPRCPGPRALYSMLINFDNHYHLSVVPWYRIENKDLFLVQQFRAYTIKIGLV